MGQGIWEASNCTENSLHDQQARKSGPQSYNHKELNSANNLNEPGSGFFPEPPDKDLDRLLSRLQPVRP